MAAPREAIVSTRTTRHHVFAALGAALLAAASCSNPVGPSGNSTSVAGSWSGTALLPNGYGAYLTLQQTGTTVTGTMKVTGVFKEMPITGAVDSSTRTFTWKVSQGCELWSGTLTIAANDRDMNGPLSIDGSGCVPQVANSVGKISLTRQ